jgi:hypothetical protein
MTCLRTDFDGVRIANVVCMVGRAILNAVSIVLYLIRLYLGKTTGSNRPWKQDNRS